MSNNLKPYTIGRLKDANMTAERIGALYSIGHLKMLKEIYGVTDGEIRKLDAMLKPSTRETGPDYRWLFRLVLTAFFGDYGLNTLMYVEPHAKPLIDRVIIATKSTEDIVVKRLESILQPSEYDVIIGIFRDNMKMYEIARRSELSESRIHQLYHKAMDKISDEDNGIADSLLELMFYCSGSECSDKFIPVNGMLARIV